MDIPPNVLLAELTEAQAAVSRSFGNLPKKSSTLKTDHDATLRGEGDTLARLLTSQNHRGSQFSVENLTSSSFDEPFAHGMGKFEVTWGDLQRERIALFPKSSSSPAAASTSGEGLCERIGAYCKVDESASGVPKVPFTAEGSTLPYVKYFSQLTQVCSDFEERDVAGISEKMMRDQLTSTDGEAVRYATLLNEGVAAEDDDTELCDTALQNCQLRKERVSLVNDACGRNALREVKRLRQLTSNSVRERREVLQELLAQLPKESERAKAISERAAKEHQDLEHAFVSKQQTILQNLDQNLEEQQARWAQVERLMGEICTLGNERRSMVHTIVKEKQDCDQEVSFLLRCMDACNTYITATQTISKSLEEERGALQSVEGLSGDIQSHLEKTVVTRAEMLDDVLFEECKEYHGAIGVYGERAIKATLCTEVGITALSSQLVEAKLALSSALKVQPGGKSTAATFHKKQIDALNSQLALENAALEKVRDAFNAELLDYSIVEGEFFEVFAERTRDLQPQLKVLPQRREAIENEIRDTQVAARAQEPASTRGAGGSTELDFTPAPNSRVGNAPSPSPSKLRESYARRLEMGNPEPTPATATPPASDAAAAGEPATNDAAASQSIGETEGQPAAEPAAAPPAEAQPVAEQSAQDPVVEQQQPAADATPETQPQQEPSATEEGTAEGAPAQEPAEPQESAPQEETAPEPTAEQ